MPNTAPALSGLATSATYSETLVNGTPQRLDSTVTLTDPDGNFAGGTVTLMGLYAPDRLSEDRFGVNNQGIGAGQIGVSGNQVTYGGVLIGILSGGIGAALQIVLNGNATSAAVDALVENLTYANVSDTPTLTRNLVINVRDADGADLGLIGGATERAGADNPFNGIGSAQISFSPSTAFVDLDNDGDQDLVTGGDDGQVRAFRNNGNGTFTQLTGASNPFNGYDIGDGAGVAFGDIDGDGDKDGFFTSNLDGFAVRFTNNGNGTFSNAGTVGNFYRGDDQGARTAFVDVDGDNDMDAVVGGRDGLLRIWLNTGGAFAETASHPFTGITFPNGSFPAPSFGDLDGDGDQDLVLGVSAGVVLTYINNGGSFTRLADSSNPFAGVAVGQNSVPTLGDMDGDGDLDLVVGSTNIGLQGRLDTFRNDAIQWGQVIQVNVDAVSDAPAGADKTITLTEDGARRFTAADFGFTDGDGNAFTGVRFTAAPVGGTLFYDADGNGGNPPVAVSGFPTAIYSIADISGGRLSFVPAADLNGGNAASIAFAVVDDGSTAGGGQTIDQSPNVIHFDIVALNDGPRLTGLKDEVAIPQSDPATPRLIDSDVSLRDPENNLAFGTLTLSGFGTANQLAEDQLGIRSQGFGAGQIAVSGNTILFGGTAIGIFSGGANGTPLEVDFNGNATAPAIEALIENLTYANSSGAPTASRTMILNVTDGDGGYIDLAGGFTDLAGADPFAGYGSAQLSFQVAPSFVDFDNDGDMDIVTGGDDGQIRTIRNNGGGSFTQLTGVNNPFNGVDVGEGSAVVFVDMNNDGKLDALVTEGLDGFGYRYTNNGNGTFSAAGAVSGFNRGSEQNGRPGVYDVDGDGDGDLVVGGRDGTLKVWLNNENGTLTQTNNHPFTGIAFGNGSFPAPTFGDYDGDGDADLLLGLNSTQILLYQNEGGVFVRVDDADNPFFVVDLVATNQNGTPALGDIDGDGDLDLLVGSTATGLAGRLDAYRNDTGQGVTFQIDIVQNFAADDGFTVNENATVNGSLLANDQLTGSPPVAEVNGSAANVGTPIVLASGATLTVNADGTFTYNPNGAFNGLAQFGSGAANQAANDSFTYRAGTSNVATVTIDVHGVYSVPHLLQGTVGVDNITGTAQADIFAASGSNDTLQGLGGDDLYYVDNAGDVVVEAVNQGSDRILASVSYTLGAGQSVEMLTTDFNAGTSAINLTGNELVNNIFGNDGANILNGGAGADTMVGRLGNEFYYVDNAGDRAIENAGEGADRIFASVSYTLAAGQSVETVSTTNNVGTTAINLTGNELANTIFGNDGANTLNGGAGIDTLVGRFGDDLYFVDNAADAVAESAGQGTDRIFAGISYVLAAGVSVETISTDFNAGTNAINLTGNELANTIFGNAGANILDGKAGADTLAGFGGNDFYYVDNAADKVVEGASEGSADRIFASVSYVLGAGVYVELLTTDFNPGTNPINLTGNELANTIFGNAGLNTLDGKAGADTLAGFGGNDFYYVDNGADRIVEGASEGTGDRAFASTNYTLGAAVYVEILSTSNNAGTGAIDLTGNELVNTLFGNAGANILDGKAGADTLAGMGGMDQFSFTSALGGGNVDRIVDFAAGEKIALDDAIFGGIGTPGAFNAGAFISGSAAADGNDRIVYNAATGQLFYDADGSGGGAAVLFATLDGKPALTAGDFMVI